MKLNDEKIEKIFVLVILLFIGYSVGDLISQRKISQLNYEKYSLMEANERLSENYNDLEFSYKYRIAACETQVENLMEEE